MPGFPQDDLVAVGRITRRADYLRAAKGRKHATPGCVVQALVRGGDGPETRVGFTATKKVGGAVIRNRAKRRLKEAARLLLPRLGRPGVDYVFIARQETAARPWPSLLDDVEKALLSLAPIAAGNAQGRTSGRASGAAVSDR